MSLKAVFQQENLTDVLNYWIKGYKKKNKQIRGVDVIAIDPSRNTVVFNIFVEREQRI